MLRICSKSPTFLLSLILVTGFFLRLGLPGLVYYTVGDKMVFHNPDTASYINAATSLATSGKFELNGRPEIVRTPGYPVVLIAGLLVGRVELVTIFLQAILSCCTIYLVFRTALLLFSHTGAALLSAALYAVEPLSILLLQFASHRDTFLSPVMFFVYFFVSYLNSKSFTHIVSSALALSASIYVRPAAYYLPFLITIVLSVWGVLSKTSRAKILSHALFFFLFSIVALGAWQARNYSATGYTGFSAIKEINLYFYNGAGALAQRKGILCQSNKNGWLGIL